MSMEAIFTGTNVLVMPFWVLMILLPGWRWTQRIVRSLWIVVPAALSYVALLAPIVGDVLPLVLQPDLDSVRAALGEPHAATLAWTHFLAFDLFVGRFIYLDSRENRVNPFLVAPILFLTLMLGPTGLLLYLGLRSVLLPASTAPSR